MKLLFTAFLLCIASALQSHDVTDHHSSWNLNIGEWLPEQVPFQALVIQADALDAYTLLQDGSYQEWRPSSSLPEMHLIREIAISGPQAHLLLITRHGETLEVPLHSIALQLNQEFRDGRRYVSLDFSCLPKPEKDDESDFPVSSIIAEAIKSLLFGGMDSVHLALHASSDKLMPQVDPSMGILLELGDGILELNLSSIGDVSKADWLLKGEIGENSVLMKRVVKAIRAIGKGASLMEVDNDYKQMIKKVLSHAKKVADITDLILKTIAGTAAFKGDLEFMHLETGEYFGDLNNKIEIKSTHENLSALIGSETSFAGSPDTPFQWRQAVIVSNPAQNLLIIARWIRENALTDLANYLNTPSITYFGYLGEKFSQTLVSVFEMLGNKQEDGSLRFNVEYDANESLWIGETCVNDLGSILYKKLKEKTYFW